MPLWHLETIYWPDLFLLFTHSCNAISGRQYLSRVLHLSVRSGTPVRPPWLDAAFPQALHFYWADPRWIATVKRRTRWSVFFLLLRSMKAVTASVKICWWRHLKTAIPLNSGEAVFPPHPFTPFQGFPLCWRGFHFRDDVILYGTVDKICNRDHAIVMFLKQVWIYFFFLPALGTAWEYTNRKTEIFYRKTT